jgi:hypothetical protein
MSAVDRIGYCVSKTGTSASVLSLGSRPDVLNDWTDTSVNTIGGEWVLVK